MEATIIVGGFNDRVVAERAGDLAIVDAEQERLPGPFGLQSGVIVVVGTVDTTLPVEALMTATLLTAVSGTWGSPAVEADAVPAGPCTATAEYVIFVEGWGSMKGLKTYFHTPHFTDFFSSLGEVVAEAPAGRCRQRSHLIRGLAAEGWSTRFTPSSRPSRSGAAHLLFPGRVHLDLDLLDVDRFQNGVIHLHDRIRE